MAKYIKIGKFIERALNEKGVSQKEIADVLGVAPNIISYFCHDKRIPNTQQVLEIANYLNVSTDYLLGYGEEIPPSTFTERLTNLRKEKKLKQEELAKNIGITRQSISHYENGSADPPIKVIVEYAKFFGVSADYLLGLSTSRTNIEED